MTRLPTLPEIAAGLAAELRRLPCRVTPFGCPGCAWLAAYDAWVAEQAQVPIVETPAVAREMVRKESDDE